jgi:hypothetical protein
MTKRQRSLFKNARPCPFCGGDYLTWMLGAVTCDECQASGPFVGHPTLERPVEELAPEGVRLWNGAPR